MGKAPEEIIGKLREAEIVRAQDGTTAETFVGYPSASKLITAGATNMAG